MRKELVEHGPTSVGLTGRGSEARQQDGGTGVESWTIALLETTDFHHSHPCTCLLYTSDAADETSTV